MLAGLWEFPGGVLDDTRVRHKFRRRPDTTIGETLKRHLPQLNGAVRVNRPIGELRHTITDKKIRAPVFLIDLPADAEVNLAQTMCWFAPSSLRHHPLAAMTLKAANLLASHEKGPA
jgi:adenine-specific DNA glycosylase